MTLTRNKKKYRENCFCVVCKHNLLIFESFESLFLFLSNIESCKEEKLQQLIKIFFVSTFGNVEDWTVNIEEYNTCSALQSQNQWTNAYIHLVRSKYGSNRRKKRASELVYRPNRESIISFLVLAFHTRNFNCSDPLMPSYSHVPYPKQTMRMKDNPRQRSWCWGWLNIQTAPVEWKENDVNIIYFFWIITFDLKESQTINRLQFLLNKLSFFFSTHSTSRNDLLLRGYSWI